MSKKRSRTKNSIMNLVTGIGGQLLTTVISFITRTVFIHYLGKSYLGINGLFTNILTMLSLTELGIDTAINFKLYKPLAEHDEHRIRILMKFYKTAYRVVGLAVMGIGLCLIPFLPNLISDYESLEPLGINASFIFILFLLQSATSYLFFASRSAIVKADQRQYLLNVSGYIVTVLTNVIEIIILVIWKSFVGYTICAVAMGVLQNFINALIAQYYYPYAFQKEKDSLNVAEIKDMFKDLGALFIYKVNGVVLKATDNLVLSAFIGLTIVGMYSNYLLFYTAIRGILDRFYSAIKASMGNLFALGETDEKYRFFEVMNFVSALLYGTACIGVAVVADEFVLTWIGEDYIIAQPFSILMGIEIILVGLKMNLGQIRNISGAFRQAWFRPLLGIIINLGVSIAMVHKFGIYGVLIGTITADITTYLMIDPRIIHRYTFNSYRPVSEYYIRNAKYAAALVLVCVVDEVICSNVLVGYGWLSVIMHAMICGISVPFAFYLIFRNRHECKYLIKKVYSILR